MASYTVQVRNPHSGQYEEFCGTYGVTIEHGGVLVISFVDGGHAGINPDHWEEFIVKEEESG